MSPPRPNVAGASRHAADIGCHRERTPQAAEGGSRAPTPSRVLPISGAPDSCGSSTGQSATSHLPSSAAASSGLRRPRSPGILKSHTEVSKEPDSAPSPKRRRVAASRRQVERFLDLAAEDSKDNDGDDPEDDDDYINFVDDQTVHEPQGPAPAPRAWQRQDDTEDLRAIAADFDERARKQRDDEWRPRDDPDSTLCGEPSGLVLREDRLVARTETAVPGKQPAASYAPYSRKLAFQRTTDSARQDSWVRLQRAPYGGRLALVLSTRVAGQHEYLVARLPGAIESPLIHADDEDDEDDLPFGLSEFPETESEEAQRLAEKKAARDTVDVCTTVVYTKPLLLHAFPPVIPTYEEMEPFLRSRHPGLEHAAFVGIDGVSFPALADADRVVGQGRYRGSSGYIMSTWDATVSGRLVRVAKVRRHLALSRRVGQQLKQKGHARQTDWTEVDVEGIQEDDMGAIVPVSDLKRHALALPPVLQLLDRVRVVGGEYRGSTGRIEAIEDDWLTIWTSMSSEGSLVVNWRDINRDFRVGDFVEVVRGLYQGHKGFVISLHAAGILQIFVEEWSEGIENCGSQLATVNSAGTPESRHLAIHAAHVNFLLLDDASACFGLELFPVLSLARGIASRAPEHLLRRLVLEERQVEERQWASMWAESGRRYEGIEVQVGFEGPHKGTRGVVVGDHDTAERAARVAAAKAAGKKYLAKQIDLTQDARGIIVTVQKEASNERFDMKIERLLHIHTWTPLAQALYLPPAILKGLRGSRVNNPPLRTQTPSPPRDRTPSPPLDRTPSPPAEEMQFPVEVPGEKTGEWLTIPGLAQKRVDVQLQGLLALSQRNFRPSKTILQLEGRTGYLLLASPVLANTLQSTKVDVYAVGRNGTKHPIAPMCIRPLRVHASTPITRIKNRVVVIGPDVVGDIKAVGRYGQTEPDVKHDFSPVAVVVRLENKGQLEGLRGVFPLSSLCLSVNVPIQAAHGNFPMTTFDEQP
ncbi:hypothetical protein GGX14DRAFT_578244 [Mycena pura]|uniref:KOW domain-containing protein n=1 Tax=Mycena pura TaxID=153505 RepID=A0AAD6UTC2_9AGAR|nr:hypothetical protein GGX14DRAFT_578244 [Mycena pura]